MELTYDLGSSAGIEIPMTDITIMEIIKMDIEIKKQVRHNNDVHDDTN